MPLRHTLSLSLAAVFLLPIATTHASAQSFPEEAGERGAIAKGVGVDLTPVSNWSYKGGTDLEFVTIKKRDYAIAPAMRGSGGEGALRIFDLTANPARPKLVGFLPCNVAQNDVQVRGTTVYMGVDYDEKSSTCFDQAKVNPATGVLAVDIANPAKPRAVGFTKIPLGAHNTTIHPGGRYLYVSDSELTPVFSEPTERLLGRINVIDVRNPRAMKQVFVLPLPTGMSSHDITFNKKGTRAYSAALTHTLILDTTKPAKPTIKTTIIDPLINISHGADLTPDETHLYVTDEQTGAAANGVCNVGGVHVFDIRNELVPVKTAFYAFSPLNSLTSTLNSENIVCTAHVLDFGPTRKTFSNAGYAAGVRIVDAVGRVGVPTELASFTPVDADTWSAKQYKNPRYLYANDLARGFDTYEYREGRGAVDTRTPTQVKLGITRIGLTTFLEDEWCAQPTSRLTSHHAPGAD
jgi:hypothetical protein